MLDDPRRGGELTLIIALSAQKFLVLILPAELLKVLDGKLWPPSLTLAGLYLVNKLQKTFFKVSKSEEHSCLRGQLSHWGRQLGLLRQCDRETYRRGRDRVDT